MRDASVFWLETTEKEIHFIDAIASAYDGLANVRRDYRLENGKVYFKVYVALGMEEEFLELIDDLRRTARIGEVLKDDEPLPAA
jgi:hypothetical protein